MLIIPTVDGVAKHLGESFSPLFVAWSRYAAATLIVLPVALWRLGPRKALPRRDLGAHLLRTAFLMAAMSFYFLAIARIPLATASGAYFVGPVVAALLAMLLLREKARPLRLAAVALGFAGAMIVVRPGDGISSGMLLALGSGICFAGYIIATRVAARSAGVLPTLAFQCLVGALLLTPQAIWTFAVPDATALVLILVMGAVSAFCHVLSINAFRYADASLLAPLVYLELVGTAAIGLFVFGEFPDAVTWAGIGVIVLAGLLLARERAR